MKKILLITLLLSLFIFDTKAFAASPPPVVAEGALLVDMNTGKILYEKNKDKVFYPASTTKIMTALLVLENCKLDDKVVIGKTPSSFIDGNKIYLFKDEEFTVEQLLNALLVESANDVGVALAEHVSGSEEAFAKLMTERAKQLGCLNTNFMNAHGLDDESHYTTAYDLSLIAREAMKSEVFRKIVNTKSYTLEPTNKQPEKRYLHTSNRMLTMSQYKIEGINGIKTGYTTAAGHSFVGSVYRDDSKVMVVLLGDKKPGLWEDAYALLNYGISSYKTIEKVAAGDYITSLKISDTDTEIPLVADKKLLYTYQVGQTPDIKSDIKLPNDFTGDIVKGQKMGSVEFTDNGEKIGTVDLIADKDLPATSLYSYKGDESGNIKKVYSAWLFIPVTTIFGISIIMLLIVLKKIRRSA